jgi:hypothetical protein
MANAVENSCVVLMCVTEKYRQSINCQSEAQYAYKMGRPIIPLIMQRGYENVTGWLGTLMCSKMSINFLNTDFEECIRRLKSEICQYYRAERMPLERMMPLTSRTFSSNTICRVPSLAALSAIPATLSLVTTGRTPNAIEAVKSMTTDRVVEWFLRNNLNTSILESLKPCDGGMLKQVYDMKCTAPLFYYQTLKELHGVDVRSIVLFSACLESLFVDSRLASVLM